MINQPKVTLTELDARSLRMLLNGAHGVREIDWPQLRALEAEMDRADIVPSHRIARDVVRMYSRVRIVDLRTGEQLVYQIVYPHEADYSKSKISVLAPIGTALLGYRAGTEIEWKVPSGTRRLRIEAVEQQSERLDACA